MQKHLGIMVILIGIALTAGCADTSSQYQVTTTIQTPVPPPSLTLITVQTNEVPGTTVSPPVNTTTTIVPQTTQTLANTSPFNTSRKFL
jgi:hypothetical protein